MEVVEQHPEDRRNVPTAGQRRILLPLTALITFLAGAFAAQGRVIAFVVMLILLLPAWVLVGLYKK